MSGGTYLEIFSVDLVGLDDDILDPVVECVDIAGELGGGVKGIAQATTSGYKYNNTDW